MLRNRVLASFIKGRQPRMATALFLVYVHFSVVEEGTSFFEFSAIKGLSVSALSHRGQQTALNEVQMQLELADDDDDHEEPVPPPLFSEGDCSYPGDTKFEKVSSEKRRLFSLSLQGKRRLV